MKKLPNPPKSKRLTKKVGLECLAILNDIDRVLFDSRILEGPRMSVMLRDATKWYCADTNRDSAGWSCADAWVRDMHDRICAARANLNTWHEAEKEKAKCRKGKK